MSRVAETILQSTLPGEDHVHAQFVKHLRTFEGALKRAGGRADILLRHRTALMNHHLARSLADRGEPREALKHLRRALDLLRPLPPLSLGLREHPWIRYDIYRCLEQVSRVLTELGDGPAAAAASAEALLVVRDLVRDDPGNPEWLDALAGRKIAHAWLHHIPAIDADEATRHAREGLKIAEGLREVDPEKPRYLVRLVQGHSVLAMIHERQGRHREELSEYEAAWSAAGELGRRRPHDREALSYVGNVGFGLGVRLLRAGRGREGAPIVLASLEASATLADWWPRLDAKVTHALRLAEWGRLLHEAVDEPAAEVAYREAIARLEALHRRGRSTPEIRGALRAIYANCPIASLRDPTRVADIDAIATDGGR